MSYMTDVYTYFETSIEIAWKNVAWKNEFVC